MCPVPKTDKLTTFMADCLEIWEPQLPGTLRACPGLNRSYYSFIIYKVVQLDEVSLK